MFHSLRRPLDWLASRNRQPPQSKETDIYKTLSSGHSSTEDEFKDAHSDITRANTPPKGDLNSIPEFKYFAELPLELRLQIWYYALNLSTPRIIVPRVASPQQRTIPKLSHQQKSSKTYHRPGPLIVPNSPCTSATLALSICIETRELAFKHFIFSTGNTRLHLNPAIDTLSFSETKVTTTTGSSTSHKICSIDTFARFVVVADVGKLQRLALSDKLLCYLGREIANPTSAPGVPYYDGPFFRKLTGLKELTVFFDAVDQARYGPPVVSKPHCELCRETRRWVGARRGWRFPTLSEFAEFKQGTNGRVWPREHLEAAYGQVLRYDVRMVYSRNELRVWNPRRLVVWMWEYIHGLTESAYPQTEAHAMNSLIIREMGRP